jgi:hypothetical protein
MCAGLVARWLGFLVLAAYPPADTNVREYFEVRGNESDEQQQVDYMILIYMEPLDSSILLETTSAINVRFNTWQQAGKRHIELSITISNGR